MGSTTSAYVYSALGQMIKKTAGSTTTLLMYDEAGHLLGEYSASGALIQETVWMGDTPVATLRPNGSTVSVYYVHTDQLNAPRKVTRPSDNGLMWRWDADPFGTPAPNQNPASLGTFIYNLRFPGQYYQAETGLNYNYFRDYDPQTGRYLESDPFGLDGGLNTYSYVGNGPLSAIDPLGLYACTYSIGAHPMTCVPNDPTHPSFTSDQFVSGNNQSSNCPDCQNNSNRTNVSDHGPLPATNYSIGPQHGLSRRNLRPVDSTQMGAEITCNCMAAPTPQPAPTAA